MREQAIRFRLGVFVLSTLILLAVLIVLFGGRPTLFRATDKYTIVFDSAPGVVPGTPVRRSGVKIGEVESVELDNDTGKVNLGIGIDHKYTLRQNDDAVLSRSLLGGDTAIDLVARPLEPGQAPDTTPLPPGAVIAGKTQLDAGELVQQAGKVIPSTEESMKEMAKVLKKVDKLMPLMEDTLKEYRDLATATKALVPEFKETNKQIQQLVKVTTALVPEFKETNKEFQQLAKAIRDVVPEFKETAKEIQQLAKSLRDMVPEFKETNKEFQQLLKSANKTLPTLNHTLEEFQMTARTWSKLGERLDILVQTNEKKFVKALDDLNVTLEGTKKVFSKENQEAVAEILKNVKAASVPLDSISKNLDLLLKDSRKTLDKFNSSVEKADRVFDNLEKVTKPMAERSDKILKNLDEATDQLNKAMSDIRKLMQAVASGQGTVSKLLSDPSLYNRLDEAACQLNKLFPRLDHILQDVETFADKIARHPELIGVGGAIRPSSGLKDLPPYPTIWKSYP